MQAAFESDGCCIKFFQSVAGFTKGGGTSWHLILITPVWDNRRLLWAPVKPDRFTKGPTHRFQSRPTHSFLSPALQSSFTFTITHSSTITSNY